MALNPNESGKYISSIAKHVRIKQNGIERLGNELLQNTSASKIKMNVFSQTKVHPTSRDPNVLDWLLVLDSLNFCFWHYDNEKGWEVDKEHGYFALCAAIKRAVKEDVKILDPHYYSVITKEQLQHVLRSDTSAEIPLIDERVECLHSVGTALIEKFEGSFKKCVEKAEQSAIKLLSLIVENFHCFRDEAKYEGRQVCLYKRAQILVGDVWSCFKGVGLGYFYDIDKITMFPDYRVPQSLLYFDVFEYSDELMKLLNENVLLENGDKMEVEIRGCSIHAVKLLVDYVNERVTEEKKVNAIMMDHFLWDYRRKRSRQIAKKKNTIS